MLKKLVLLLIIGAVVAGAGALWLRHRMGAPYRAFVADEVFVDLAPGTSVAGIAAQLAEAGVVPDALTFRLAARLSGADRRLQAGEYRFAGEQSPFEVVWRLAAGDVYTRPVTFPEGLTIREMAPMFERAGLGTAAAFETAAADRTLAATIGPSLRSLEGYLFPDTYPLPRRVSAEHAVRVMLARFDTGLRRRRCGAEAAGARALGASGGDAGVAHRKGNRET